MGALSKGRRLYALDTRRYLPVFMEEKCREGTLTLGEYRRIQKELIALVRRQGSLWCGGESGSLPVEMGERLLSSILYVIGLELKYYDEETGLTLLKKESAEEIFERGMVRMGRRTRICLHRWQYLKSRLFETPNVFYNGTLKGGLRGFFKLYAPTIDALDLHITADYTPCLGRPEEGGIEFMESYLTRLEAENAFCLHFSAERADRLLRRRIPDYEEGMVNLFEQILLEALGCVLVGKNPRLLELTEAECAALQRELEHLSQQEREQVLGAAWEKLGDNLGLTKRIRAYGSLCLPAVSGWVQCLWQ